MGQPLVIKNTFDIQNSIYIQPKLAVQAPEQMMTKSENYIEETSLYFNFSDSMAFLLSLTLARKAGPRTDITTLVENIIFGLIQLTLPLVKQ